MPPELTKDRQKRYIAGKAQNLLKEHGAFIQDIINETISEYSQEINDMTVDGLAIQYSRQQGARQSLLLFMRKLNGKANE